MISAGQRHDRTALVLYGSETGSAQEIAEEMGRLAERLRFSTRVAEFDRINLKELLSYAVVLFAVSTTGQGELPGNARLFWRKLRNARLQPGCLTSLRFASFGLGDSSYPQFNWAHRKLYNRLRVLGAEPFVERGESDEQHPEGIEGCFLPWSVKLRQALLEHLPLPEGSTPIPDDKFLTPKWAFSTADDGENHPVANVNGEHVRNDGEKSLEAKDSSTATHTSSTSSVTAQTSMSGRQSLTIELTKNERLTPEDHWQDVRMFEFSTDPVHYSAGDVLTIFPKNSSNEVDMLLRHCGWASLADLPGTFEPTSSSSAAKFYPPPPLSKNTVTLRELLTDHLDIYAIPRRSFFVQIAHFTDDEMQKERLLDFTDPQYVDELYDYTSRPRRSIIEVLQEFDTVKIPLKWVASIFPTMRGRQFSIASGGQLRVDEAGRGRIQLLVAIVKYKTVIKKIREGLCTKYLTSLQPGAMLEAVLCKGGMKHDISRPALMVGPGTGLAPLRAMLYERSEVKNSNISNTSALFFGGRNRNADFFFSNEWPALESSIHLRVKTAFSRDQKSKIYVQDVLRKEAELVHGILVNGNIYICGSSGKMPQAVREALIEVIEQQGNKSREDAEIHLKAMENDGRYQQETW